jgi:hypothetical protein
LFLGLIEAGASGQQIKLWSDTYLRGNTDQWSKPLSATEEILYNSLVVEGKAPATFDPENSTLLRLNVQSLFKKHYGFISFYLFRPDIQSANNIPTDLSEKAWNYGRRRILLYSLVMNSPQAKAGLAAAAGASEIMYQMNPITFAWDKGWTIGSGESFISGEESSRLRAVGEFAFAIAMVKGISTLRTKTYLKPDVNGPYRELKGPFDIPPKQLHHTIPQYMGGSANQEYAALPRTTHFGYHEFLDNWALPEGMVTRTPAPKSFRGAIRPWGRENAAALKLFAEQSQANRIFIVENLRATFKQYGIYGQVKTVFESEARIFIEGAQ